MKFPLWLKVKAATARAIADAGGNKVCAAAVTRIERVATFSDYANEAEIKRVIPLDTAIELDAFNSRAGKPPQLIALAAAELGHVLIRLPQASGMNCIIEGSGELATRLGQVMAEVGAALADGEIDAREARAILGKIDRLIVAAHSFAQAVEREAQEDEP